MGKNKNIKPELAGVVYIKFVKKANAWCRTSFPNGEQKIEWFATKEEAEKKI